MDLNPPAASYGHVLAFLAVVREGSFARAGVRLGVGRSAVSRSVQKLEDHLAARLFARTTRRTALTPEGARFYASCEPGVARIAQALADIRELRGGPPRGTLHLAAPVGYGRRVIAPLVPAFQAAYPDVAVDLRLDDALADLATGRVELAFREGPVREREVVARRLAASPLVLCAAPGYLATRGAPRDVDALADHRCLVHRLTTGALRAWQLRAGGEARTLAPTAAATFNDPELVLEAALAGGGIAQLAGYQVAAHLAAGRLVALLPHGAPAPRVHHACYASRKHLPGRVRAFLDHVTAHLAQGAMS